MNNTQQFQELYDRAHQAGHVAATRMIPVPMVVGQVTDIFSDEIDYSKETYYVSEGVCGFAQINIRPGNSALANWLKKNGLAQKAYNGGIYIWVSDYWQSMQRKEAYANAFAKILSEAGYNAHASSRMD